MATIRIEEEIDIAFPRLGFELRKTAKPGYLSLGIARVLEIHDRNIDAMVKSLKSAAARAGAGLRTVLETSAGKEADGDPLVSDSPAPLHGAAASVFGSGLHSFGFRG